MPDFDEVRYAVAAAHRFGVTGREYLSDYGYDPSTPCWKWTGATFRKGYGNTHITRFDGVHANIGAHRLAWMGLHGDLPEGKPFITHGCDNPICCRPSHLRPDDQKGNLDGMRERGRSGDCANYGESNGVAKLTAEAVRRIRSEPKRYGRVTSLAREYGVSDVSIQNVLRGKTWRSVV